MKIHLLAGPLAVSAAVLSVGAFAFRRDAVVGARLGARAGASDRLPPGHRIRGRARRIAGLVGSHPVIVRISPRVSEAELHSAGWSLSQAELRGVRVLGGLIGAVVAAAAVPVLMPVTAVIGSLAPSLALARAARARRARADSELPQLLDLLAAASSAGLAAPLALERSAPAIEGPLAEELARMLRAVHLGARWRDELRKMAERLPLPDLRRTVAALTRTETLGVSLSDALIELAARVREARRASAAERARTAPVKMLFPLVFLILPAFLLLTVVPVLLSTVRSIR